MESILNFLLLVGFLFIVLVIVAFTYARSNQANAKPSEEEKKRSEAIAAGEPGSTDPLK